KTKIMQLHKKSRQEMKPTSFIQTDTISSSSSSSFSLSSSNLASLSSSLVVSSIILSIVRLPNVILSELFTYFGPKGRISLLRTCCKLNKIAKLSESQCPNQNYAEIKKFTQSLTGRIISNQEILSTVSSPDEQYKQQTAFPHSIFQAGPKSIYLYITALGWERWKSFCSIQKLSFSLRTLHLVTHSTVLLSNLFSFSMLTCLNHTRMSAPSYETMDLNAFPYLIHLSVTNLCMDDILKFRGHFTTLSISYLWNLNRTNVTDISLPLITCSALQQCRVLQVPRLSCTQDIWDSHIVMLSSL